MPKAKTSKPSKPPEVSVKEKVRIAGKKPDFLKPKREPMTKFKFVLLVLQGTAAVQTFILIFSVYAAVIFFGHIKEINIAQLPYQNNSTFRNVIYRNDKIFYRPDEMIKLDIINNANESIYLAPCQYFNKFEKKISDKWQAVFLAACDEVEVLTDSGSIEKISERAEESFMAKKLGEGVWRGVSTVYFGCQKAQIASCKNSQTIYTNEFAIGERNLADFFNPQL